MSFNDYYQHVITKPEKISFQNQHSNILVIDSRDRNKFLYSNPNNFSIEIENTLYDVIEVELISIYYNYNRLMYDTTNNKIYLKKQTNQAFFEYSIEIPTGNYDNTELIDIFNTTYARNKLFFQDIENDIDFTLKFNTNVQKFYLFLGNTLSIHVLDFKGTQISYPNTLYGNIANNTNIHNYKTRSDGRFIGFSANEFTNNILNNQFITNYNTTALTPRYEIIINLETVEEADKLINIIDLRDNNFVLNFINNNLSNPSVETLSDDNILAHRKISNTEVELYIRNNVQFTFFNNLIPNTPSTFTNFSIFTNIILGDIQSKSERDDYLLLDITEFNRLDSNNKNINNSFVDIPVSNKTIFENTKNHGTIKYFNPPLKKLDRLSINIKDYFGKILDDHNEYTMIFAFKCMNNKDNIVRN